MAWARIEFLTPQAKISCPRGFATWARIFAFGVKNSILALAIGWESYIPLNFAQFTKIFRKLYILVSKVITIAKRKI